MLQIFSYERNIFNKSFRNNHPESHCEFVFHDIFQAGPYWADLFDLYGASFSLLLFAFFECIGLSWFYGLKRFKNDIRSMVGNCWVDFPLFYWWLLNWVAITPAVLLVRSSVINILNVIKSTND